MFCDKCGNQLKDGAKFCTKCGEKVVSSTNIPSAEQVLSAMPPAPPINLPSDTIRTSNMGLHQQKPHYQNISPTKHMAEDNGSNQTSSVVPSTSFTSEEKKQSNIKKDTRIGSIGATWMIIIGVILASSCIGAIIGIPMILGGIETITGQSIVGFCPYCKSEIHASKNYKGITCEACKKRLVIKDNKFILVE